MVDERGLRLSATSSSRRVLALEFVRRYFRDFGQSPSLREIGAAIGAPAQRAHGIVVELHRRGDILWTPGQARSIRLPERIDELSDTEALELLARRGWTINDAVTETQMSRGQAAVHTLLRAEGVAYGVVGEDQA